jgi:hypothetical protein
MRKYLIISQSANDAPIDTVSLSGFGGWFVRFKDGECEWEALPSKLTTLLIANIRRGDPPLLALSPSDSTSYFLAIGDEASFVHVNASNFRTLKASATLFSGAMAKM